jgi:hypothetical protein
MTRSSHEKKSEYKGEDQRVECLHIILRIVFVALELS